MMLIVASIISHYLLTIHHAAGINFLSLTWANSAKNFLFCFCPSSFPRSVSASLRAWCPLAPRRPSTISRCKLTRKSIFDIDFSFIFLTIYSYERYILPGQDPRLQCSVSVGCPLHVPKYCSVTVLGLAFVLIPSPHVLEHCDQEPQFAQVQSTAEI